MPINVVVAGIAAPQNATLLRAWGRKLHADGSPATQQEIEAALLRIVNNVALDEEQGAAKGVAADTTKTTMEADGWEFD